MKNILIEFRQEWELTDEAVELALEYGKIYECIGGHGLRHKEHKIFHCTPKYNNLMDISLIAQGVLL